MPFAELSDARLHYELCGPPEATVLVLSNSLGSNLSMWDQQLPRLSKHFRVLRYDTRGHGRSSVTPGPYTIDLLGRDVVSLLDILHLGPIHFCGLSMGGSTGMWLAIHAPELLNRLILCNTAAKIGTPEVWNPRMETVRQGGVKAISSGVVGRWLSQDYRAKFPQVAADALRMLESADTQGYLANAAAIRDFDAREAIKSIRLPTLVISGTHDVSTTVADGRYLQQNIPGACYVQLDAAHLSNIEQSDQFTSEVLHFLVS
jgi:3-oxoadipate enol-lactonase